jgi:cytidylate kinase
MIVAIDGPAGSGKSSAAKRLAKRLGLFHLDSGAVYRAFTWLATERAVAPDNESELAALVTKEAISLELGEDGTQRVSLEGRDISEVIRTPEVTRKVAAFARLPAVRARVTNVVRAIARTRDVITDGRDTTTAIFPNADIKIYVDASPEERARRRGLELKTRGTPVPHAELLAAILERDRSDRERPVGPLRIAEDATYLDTSDLDLNAVVERLAEIVAAGQSPNHNNSTQAS